MSDIKESRRHFRQEKRRRSAFEQHLLHEARKEWVLWHYPCMSARRSYLRSLEYEEEIWSVHQPHPFIVESGEDDRHYDTDHKSASRSAAERSRASRKLERSRFKSANTSKEWSKIARQRMKDEIKKVNAKYQPESGIDFAISEKFCKRFEDFLLYVATLQETNTCSQVVLATLTYAKSFTDRSVSRGFVEYVQEVMKGDAADDGDMFEQSGSSFVPESKKASRGMLFNGFKMAAANFKSFVEHPVFSKISYLISAAICAGMLDQTNTNWSIGGITLFSKFAYLKHIRASDLISAICDTFIYFVEGGIEFFKTGSLAGFLYSDSKIGRLDDAICYLRANSVHVRTGNLQNFTGMTDTDFDNRLTDVTNQVKDLLKTVSGFEKTLMNQKLQRCYDLRAEFDTSRVSGGNREAPYVVQLYGPTAVGKTNLTNVIAVAVGKMNGFCVDDDRIVTLKADDKFQSNMRGDTNVVVLDDVFNTAAQFLDASPTALINTIANNAIAYCNMAEAEQKGKISFLNKLLIINTNIEDMGASVGSNEPASIQRRAHVKIDVSVKDEFKKQGSHTLDYAAVSMYYLSRGIEPPPIEDLWKFTVTKPMVVPGKALNSKDVVKYVAVIDKDGPLIDCDIFRFLKYLNVDSKAYYASEKDRVKRMNGLSKRINICKECNHLEQLCVCTAANKYQKYVESSASDDSLLVDSVRNSLLTLMPDSWLAWLVRYHFGACHVGFYNRASILARCVFLFLAVLSDYLYNTGIPLIVFTLLFIEFYFWGYISRVNRLVSSRNIITKICLAARETNLAKTISLLGGMLVVYKIAKRVSGGNSFYKMLIQGSLSPINEEEVKARDGEFNCWAKPKVKRDVVPRELATATVDQIVDTVFDNLCVLRIQETNKFRTCNAFVVKSNLFLMPYHMLFESSGPRVEPDRLMVSLQRREPDCGGSTVTGFISRSRWMQVPGTDFLLVSFPNMGSYRDLTKLFVDSEHNGPTVFVHKNGDGTMRREPISVLPCDSGHNMMNFRGYEYHVGGGTKPGLCMSVLVTKNIGPHICGFHLGGTATGSGDAVGGSLTKTLLMATIDDLVNNREFPMFIPHSASIIPAKQYGLDIVTSDELNPNCPLFFMEDIDGVVPLGSCSGGVTATSRVVPTLISTSVEKHLGVPCKWGKPNFFPKWKPWRDTLCNVGVSGMGFDQTSVDWAVEDYLYPILNKLRKDEYARNMCVVLDDKSTINGIPGLRFIDRMVINTAAGFPLGGTKEKYVEHLGPTDLYDDELKLVDEICAEVSRLENAYLADERAYPVYKAILKDEPTKLGKDKTRVIYCAPIALQFLCRKYFLGITRFMQTHPLLCETAVGINCASQEWQQLRDHCTVKGTNCHRGFGVDYSKYDARTPAQISTAVAQIFLDIARCTNNYSERDLKIMTGVLTDSTFPLVAYNGTLLEYLLSFISGDTLTVHKNCCGNSLYQRIGFYEVEVKARRLDTPLLSERFRDNVAAVNYGDDVQGTIMDDVVYYNMSSYASFMATHGIIVTMPDKSDTMVEFLHWDDMDFLKRSDQYIPEIDQIVGKLELDSIFKSLHCRLLTKGVSKEEHASSVLEGAAGELFLHGRSVYEDVVSKLSLVAEEHELYVPGLVKDFDKRVEVWLNKYKRVAPIETPTNSFVVESGVESFYYHLTDLPLVQRQTEQLWLLHDNQFYYSARALATDYSVSNRDGTVLDIVAHTLFIRIDPGSNTFYYSCVMGLTRVLREPGNFNNCIKGTDRSTQMSGNIGTDVPTSENYFSSTGTSSMVYSSDSDPILNAQFYPEYGVFDVVDGIKSKNTTVTQHTDINPGHIVVMGDTSDNTFGVADRSDTDLGNFFQRPIVVFQYEWQIRDQTDVEFNPWRLYLNDKRVANRITNYRNLRGRLHLKFTINGSQFHYGLMIASYRPLPIVDSFTRYTGSSTDLIPMSQAPHVYLDANLSQGAEMVLPFFWAFNSIRLDGTDMDNLGIINMKDMTPLLHTANEYDLPVTITVLAWMEDLTLSGPTDAPINGLVPQSGSSDEYGVSPARKMAEQLVRTSGMLINKPMIGPYAKATQMMTSMALDVASAFGYSKPNCIEPIVPMRPTTCGSLANTNVPDATQKLSLDAKQEVIIDPRTVGLSGDDEMDLVQLACKESYVGQTVWTPNEQPGAVIWSQLVTPMQYDTSGTQPIKAVHMTPSAWVAAPFAYWRGTMKVRIKVVCSSFQKGRLRVYYDPVTATSDPDLNVVFNHIIDIAECKDFVFTIGWSNNKSYCLVDNMTDSRSFAASSAPIVGSSDGNNGSFAISVLNTLTTPDSSNLEGVNICVFTSMCDDFEVQGPSSQVIQNYMFLDPNPPPGFAFVPESGVIQDGEETCDPSAPTKTDEEPEAKMAAPMLSTVDETPGIYFGESITNWKQVLKRYNLHRGWTMGPTTAASAILDLAISNFPMYRGLTPIGIDTSTSGPYNYCDTTLMNWVVPCYAGYRGGIRWKYATAYRRGTSDGNMHMQLTRTPIGNLGYLNTTTPLTASTDRGPFALTTRAQISHTCSGATFTNRTFNPTVEGEFPHQTFRRFYSGRRDNPNLLNSEFPCHRFQVFANEITPSFLTYVAAGEDFQTFFFVSVPPVWFSITDIPTA